MKKVGDFRKPGMLTGMLEVHYFGLVFLTISGAGPDLQPNNSLELLIWGYHSNYQEIRVISKLFSKFQSWNRIGLQPPTAQRLAV